MLPCCRFAAPSEALTPAQGWQLLGVSYFGERSIFAGGIYLQTRLGEGDLCGMPAMACANRAVMSCHTFVYT